MILTCKACATRYLLERGEIGPLGRRVQCAECGAQWRIDATGAEIPAPPVVDPLRLDLPAHGTDAAAQAAPEPLWRIGDEPLMADDPAPLFTARPISGKGPNRPRWPWVGGALAVVLIGALLLFHQAVEHQWPQTVPIYAAIGL